MTDVQIRPYDPSDKEFILHSWLTSYKHTSAHTKRIRNQVYFNGQEERIKELIKKPTVFISLAVDPTLPDAIYGYIVYEIYKNTCPTIHYLYVKEDFRKMGIARGLWTFAGLQTDLDRDVYFTHWTNPMDSIVNRKDVRLIYDPYKV